MPVPSLIDLCTKACVKNIRSTSYHVTCFPPPLTCLGLNDVGSFEYWKIRTVLQRIESPEQLHEVEINSPHIRGEDAELWRAFIARDIPNWRTKNYSPKNPLKWYEVYCRYKKEQREEIKRDEDILRNTMMGLNRDKQTHVSKVVDLRSLPKLPRDPRMIANNGGVPLKGKVGFRKEAASSLLFSAGSKTKITDGKSVLTKARREAKEISAMGKLARPTHQLKGRMGQVVKAPAGMAAEYKIANQPAIKILSRKRLPPGQFEGSLTGSRLEEREKRLRAMQSKTAGAASETLVGSSDDDLDNDLFDDGEEDEDEDEDDNSHYRSTTHATSSRPLSSNPTSRPTSTRPNQTSSSPPSRSVSRSTGNARPGPSSSVSTPNSRNESPAPGVSRPMMAKRKPPVDVFNRGAKKPRAR
jgi:elongin-A